MYPHKIHTLQNDDTPPQTLFARSAAGFVIGSKSLNMASFFCRSCLFVRLPDRTGVYFLKSYVGFAEFVGAKILYALALGDEGGSPYPPAGIGLLYRPPYNIPS
jgi:hypothetical protein